jgi:hypothetical protein
MGSLFEMVFVFDFARATEADPMKGFTEIARIVANTGGLCIGLSPDVVKQGRLVSFRFEDRNRDGAPDLVLEIEHKKTPLSRGLEKRVEKACAEAADAGKEGEIDPGKLLGAPRVDTLEFLWQAGGFKPNPRTKAIVDSL